MARKSILLLFAFLLLGFAIRAYKISSNSLYGDELTLTYDTYSILKTGMDQTGARLPLTFKMGANRPGGYIYFSVPFVALFGPTEVGIRALSIFSGLGIVVLMYFLGKKLFNEKVGLIASFFTAISPWDIFLSRGGFEAHLALFFAILGTVLFLYADEKECAACRQAGFYIPWAITWGLTVFTYPTFKLTLPILFLILIWYKGGFKNFLSNKLFWTGIVILAFFAAISIQQTFTANSEARFLSLNIFSDENTRQLIIQNVSRERTVSTLPSILRPIFTNSPIEYGKKLLDNYAQNISPSFLYLRGDGNPVHNTAEFGMFFYIDAILLFIAIVNLWQKEKRVLIFLGTWILIVPLATMFLGEAHGLRNDLMIPPFLMLSAYSFSVVSKKSASIFISLMILELIFILVRVYFIAPGKFVEFWSAPAKAASLEAISAINSKKQITLSTKKIDNIEYAYPVYAKIDPRIVIAQYGKFPKIYGNVIITDQNLEK